MLQIYLGLTLQTIGGILIAFAMLQLFQRVTKKSSFAEGEKDIKPEVILGAVSIIFMMIGFVLQITAL
ncbi:MAG: hypothetical protein ACOYUZ_01820 [Patescibacteria group bacterium]